MVIALSPVTGPANDLPSQGLYISSVEDYSDLNNHDITVGDVILTADGVTLETTSDLLDVLETHKPGETVRLEIQKRGSGNVVIARIEADALVIPQSATNELQDKIFVYKVVDGKVVATEITVDRLSDGREYIVRSGLEAGEVIVTEGVGMLRDGMEMEIEIGKEAER